MKQAAVVIAFFIIIITEGVLIDRQANRNRKNWKLVKKAICVYTATPRSILGHLFVDACVGNTLFER